MFRIIRYELSGNGKLKLVDIQEYKDQQMAIDTLIDWTSKYPKHRVAMEVK